MFIDLVSEALVDNINFKNFFGLDTQTDNQFNAKARSHRLILFTCTSLLLGKAKIQMIENKSLSDKIKHRMRREERPGCLNR